MRRQSERCWNQARKKSFTSTKIPISASRPNSQVTTSRAQSCTETVIRTQSCDRARNRCEGIGRQSLSSNKVQSVEADAQLDASHQDGVGVHTWKCRTDCGVFASSRVEDSACPSTVTLWLFGLTTVHLLTDTSVLAQHSWVFSPTRGLW